MIWEPGLAVVQFFIGIVFAVFSIFLGTKIFDNFTHNIDEWEEIKKGNLAVGLFLAAIILSIALMIEPFISGLTGAINPSLALVDIGVLLAIGIVELLIGLLLAVITIYIVVRVWDEITVDIDELTQLKKGNMAISVILSAVLFSVAYVLRLTIVAFVEAINLKGLLGL